MADKIEFLTPVGRIVQGSLSDPQTKDLEGHPLVYKSGPNKGQPRVDYFFALAIPKTDPGAAELWQKMQQGGRLNYPQLFDASGNCTTQKFSWKLVDGDSQQPNEKNIKPCDREGYPGNFVFSFSSSFAPKCFTKGGTEVITDLSTIKAGYYVRVYGTIASNTSTSNPGIKLNHNLIEFIGYGKEIVFGPSGESVFGGSPVSQLPAGASVTPLAPNTTLGGMPGAPGGMPGAPGGTPGAPGGMPGAPGGTPGAPGGMPGAPGGMPGAPGGMPGAPGGMPGAGVQPAPDFLNPPPAAPDEKYSYQGAAYTRSQLESFNWTPEQIATLPRA